MAQMQPNRVRRLLINCVGYCTENDAVITSNAYAEKRHKNGNNNNVNISTGEFRTISLGIHSELAKLRMSVATHRQVPRTRKPLEKEAALEMARQITNLYSEEPLFVTAGHNGAHMCVLQSTGTEYSVCWGGGDKVMSQPSKHFQLFCKYEHYKECFLTLLNRALLLDNFW